MQRNSSPSNGVVQYTGRNSMLMLISVFTWSVSVCPVSDLHEEGKNAINAPMLPTGMDIHPEDTLLGMYEIIHGIVLD